VLPSKEQEQCQEGGAGLDDLGDAAVREARAGAAVPGQRPKQAGPLRQARLSEPGGERPGGAAGDWQSRPSPAWSVSGKALAAVQAAAGRSTVGLAGDAAVLTSGRLPRAVQVPVVLHSGSATEG
jgi:hypothetical protein